MQARIPTADSTAAAEEESLSLSSSVMNGANVGTFEVEIGEGIEETPYAPSTENAERPSISV